MRAQPSWQRCRRMPQQVGAACLEPSAVPPRYGQRPRLPREGDGKVAKNPGIKKISSGRGSAASIQTDVSAEPSGRTRCRCAASVRWIGLDRRRILPPSWPRTISVLAGLRRHGEPRRCERIPTGVNAGGTRRTRRRRWQVSTLVPRVLTA